MEDEKRIKTKLKEELKSINSCEEGDFSESIIKSMVNNKEKKNCVSLSPTNNQVRTEEYNDQIEDEDIPRFNNPESEQKFRDGKARTKKPIKPISRYNDEFLD